MKVTIGQEDCDSQARSIRRKPRENSDENWNGKCKDLPLPQGNLLVTFFEAELKLTGRGLPLE